MPATIETRAGKFPKERVCLEIDEDAQFVRCGITDWCITRAMSADCSGSTLDYTPRLDKAGSAR
jgi:hypothetical protein